jgi:hypothetical protein
MNGARPKGRRDVSNSFLACAHFNFMMPSPNMEDASALDLPDSLPAAAWDRNAARRALDVRHG